MEDDFFVRTVVWAMVSFLLFEALLPPGLSKLSFLFLTLQSTIIYVLGLVREGGGITVGPATARLLITYVALAALIVKTDDEL